MPRIDIKIETVGKIDANGVFKGEFLLTGVRHPYGDSGGYDGRAICHNFEELIEFLHKYFMQPEADKTPKFGGVPFTPLVREKLGAHTPSPDDCKIVSEAEDGQ